MTTLRAAAAPLTASALDAVEDARLALKREEWRESQAAKVSGKARPGANSKAGRRAGDNPIARVTKHMLRVGDLPPDMLDLAKGLAGLQLILEDAVKEDRKRVSAVDALLIQSVLSWEAHRQKVVRWMKLNYSEMKLGDKVSFSREEANAASRRTQALRELGLAHKVEATDPWKEALESAATPATEVRDAEA